VLFIQRIEQTDNGKYKVIGGVWHSEFRNGIWSSPDRFIFTLPAVSNIRAVVSQGNILLAVWIEDQGVGQKGVWYSYSKLDVPELPVKALAPVAPVESFPVESSPILESDLPVISSPTAVSFSPQLATNNEQGDYNPALPLIISTMLVILLVVGFVIYYRSNHDVRGQ
jgi:hypothetical protein